MRSPRLIAAALCCEGRWRLSHPFFTPPFGMSFASFLCVTLPACLQLNWNRTPKVIAERF